MTLRAALALSVLLVGCAVDEDPSSLPTEAAPPPGTPAFVVGEAFQGSPFTATWA